jgi:hypothetical protein
MNSTLLLRFGLMIVLMTSVLPGRAEETVMITKARLEELERKEKELDALRGELSKARGEQEHLRQEKAKVESEKAQLAQAKEAAEARVAAAVTTAEPVIMHDTPALTSLPPLKKGEVVDALDLMNHFRADAVGAERRYGKQRIQVRGVVTGFEKPMFVSHYFITLQSTERNWKIVCHVDPPREFQATYPAQHGETLVGVTVSGARIALARVGQTVEIEASPKGLKEQTLTLFAGRLVSAD